MLLATEKIWTLDSALDDTGRDVQEGPLLSALGKAGTSQTTERSEGTHPEGAHLEAFLNTLRADQAPALDYGGETMAITAVPGAGKTYVNVALVLKLIAEGTPPERILMLTYMDSAAKTMLRRIRSKLAEAGLSPHRTPLVTTIHGLAYKILNDNEHALLLGLEPGALQVIDDVERSRLMQQAARLTVPEGQSSVDSWAKTAAKGINHAKSLGLSALQLEAFLRQAPVGAETARLRQLLPTFVAFNRLMQAEGGGLDFSDLILKAIQLLEGYATIRAHYQAQFSVILEDEAQDSSRLLQRFIALLSSGEHEADLVSLPSNTPNLIRTGERASEPVSPGSLPLKMSNLIRTGDTNQSITTTFTAAEPEVFRQFIADARRVIQMDHSARCAPEIIQLANHWLHEAPKQCPDLHEAFVPITMHPVVGQNPALLAPITCHAADTLDDEMHWLTTQIQASLHNHPDAKIAVLTRRNTDADRIALLLHQAGIKALSLSDALPQQAVWGLMAAWLSVLNQPVDVSAWHTWLDHATTLNVLDLASLTLESRDQLKALLSEWGPRVALPAQNVSGVSSEIRAVWMQLRFDWLDDFRLAARNDACAVMMRAGDRWLNDVAHQSNAYLAAQYLHAALRQEKDLESTTAASSATGTLSRSLAWLTALSRHPAGKKSFLLEDAAQNAQVVVMSLHKSKGQEFDVVFLPMLTRRLFPAEAGDVRLDEADRLTLALNRVSQQADADAQPTMDASQSDQTRFKHQKIAEEARLIYVGLTRAKRSLYLSTHDKSPKRDGGFLAQSPALAFTVIQQALLL